MDTLAEIKKLGSTRLYSKDEVLFNAENQASGLYYVQSGEISVFKMDKQGKEVEIVRLFPGEFFGEAILFTSQIFPAFARAVKDSEVLFFDKDVLFTNIDKNPSIARFFLSLMAQKCVTLNQRIEMLGLQTVRQRLARYLLSNCSGEKSCLIDLKTRKGELAKMLGTISETLSRNLKMMQDDGLIEVRGNKIFIHDCLKLKEEFLSGKVER